MNFQSLVELAPWTTIAQICNLLIQIVLFKKFLFQPIKNIIAKRQAEVDGLYDEAGKAKADAEEAKAAYETHLKTASEEAKAITVKAHSDIQLERRKVFSEMKTEISDIAIEIAEKVTEKEIDSEKHRELIDSFIDQIGEAS